MNDSCSFMPYFFFVGKKVRLYKRKKKKRKKKKRKKKKRKKEKLRVKRFKKRYDKHNIGKEGMSLLLVGKR